MSPAAQQYLTALERATEVRLARAAVKRELRALGYAGGARRCADLLEEPSAALHGMNAIDLLAAIPRIGETRATRLVRLTADVRGLRRIGELTERQRGRLAEALRAMGGE